MEPREMGIWGVVQPGGNMKHRKPLRSDWRLKQPKKRIPALTGFALLSVRLRALEARMGWKLSEVGRLFVNSVMAYPVPPLKQLPIKTPDWVKKSALTFTITVKGDGEGGFSDLRDAISLAAASVKRNSESQVINGAPITLYGE